MTLSTLASLWLGPPEPPARRPIRFPSRGRHRGGRRNKYTVSVRTNVTGWMARALLVVLLFATLLVAGCQAAAAPTQGVSDAQVQAKMIANIAEFDTIKPKVSQAGTDVYYKDGILFVAVLVPKGPAADALCRTIAAITNDPDTGRPLGIRGVVVLAGKDELATCRP